MLLITDIGDSFRPLTGINLLNRKYNDDCRSSTKQFPSPYGDKSFKHMLCDCSKCEKNCFRPLTGINLLNLIAHTYMNQRLKSFRPLTGINLLNYIMRNNFVCLRPVSVPLRG